MVPECESGENSHNLPYDQPWLKYAIPWENGKFDSCYRFAPKNNANYTVSNQCTADMFDRTVKISCSEYVHASDERNVQTEVRTY